MTQFQHKTTNEVVDAAQWQPGTALEGVTPINRPFCQHGSVERGVVTTREGHFPIFPNEWLIRRASGDLEIVTPTVFSQDYQPVATSQPLAS